MTTIGEAIAQQGISSGLITPRTFYMTYAWEQKARRIIKRDNHECQRCKRGGKYHRAECVHHKQELKQRPDLAFDDDNLEALCKRCHNIEHGKHLKAKQRSKPRFTTVERW